MDKYNPPPDSLEYVLATICTERVNNIVIHNKSLNKKLELVVSFDVFTTEHIEWRMNCVADVHYQNIAIALNTTLKSFSEHLTELGTNKVIKSYHEDVREGSTNWDSHPPYILQNFNIREVETQNVRSIIEKEILSLIEKLI
jgi:hypothetical protein